MSKKKTHEEYVEELKIVHPNIEVLESYKNSLTNILHRCKIHNYEWYVKPANLLYHTGCPKCSGYYKRNHNDYVKEIEIKNPNIVAIDEYIDAKTQIKHKCLIHNVEWYATPTSILNGGGCSVCHKEKLSRSKSKTHEEYLSELYDVHPNIIALERYKGALTPIKHKCIIDNYEWESTPVCVLRHDCPRCSKRERFTQDEFVKKINNINPQIDIIGEYKNMRHPIRVRCNIDGYEWDTRPDLLIKKIKCPVCNKKSMGEITISNYLDSHNILYESQKTFEDCKDIKSLHYDFYIPDINTCIEYDGIQHFKPVDFAGKGDEWVEYMFLGTKKRDDIKNEYCKSHGINLIRIPYYKDIESELNLLFT